MSRAACRITALFVTAAVACLLACGCTAAHSGSAAAGPGYQGNLFVVRDGDHLTLAGETYQFVGINMYAAAGWDGCTLGQPLAPLLKQFAAGRPVNYVIRAWANPPADPAGTINWTGIDQLLRAARASHMRVILSLDNQWGACEPHGTYKGPAWYQGGYRGSYLTWVDRIVTRYRNNPTILAWQLLDEPEVAQYAYGPCAPDAYQLLENFAATVSGTIKKLDPHHLISLGTIGGNQCGMATNDQYAQLNSLPSIDLCEVHSYPYQAPNVAARITQCRALGKPLLVGEYGLPHSTTGRIRVATHDISTYLQDGAAGILLWGYEPDQYDVPPTDPEARLLHVIGPSL